MSEKSLELKHIEDLFQQGEYDQVLDLIARKEKKKTVNPDEKAEIQLIGMLILKSRILEQKGDFQEAHEICIKGDNYWPSIYIPGKNANMENIRCPP